MTHAIISSNSYSHRLVCTRARKFLAKFQSAQVYFFSSISSFDIRVKARFSARPVCVLG
jgi:hypothetical protein